MAAVEPLHHHSEPLGNEADPWVPVDTFGARLALIRQRLGGWNVKKVAQFCGIDDQTWRNWEAGTSPRDYEEVCRQIANAVGCDRAWLKAGGPLRSRCFSGLDLIEGLDEIGAKGQIPGQRRLAVAITRTVAASAADRLAAPVCMNDS